MKTICKLKVGDTVTLMCCVDKCIGTWMKHKTIKMFTSPQKWTITKIDCRINERVDHAEWIDYDIYTLKHKSGIEVRIFDGDGFYKPNQIHLITGNTFYSTISIEYWED